MEPATTTRHRARRHDTEARRVSAHQLPCSPLYQELVKTAPMAAKNPAARAALLRILGQPVEIIAPPGAKVMPQ